MVIYFISALLISAMVYTLGAYSMLISLMVTASKVVVALTGLVAIILLYKHWKRKRKSIKFISAS